MYLKPSEIFFSQDSINNVFDKNCAHSYQPIGKTLDALCDGSISVGDIPTISVVKHDNKWFTADNRRLWVFRNLERLEKCSEIYVTEGYYIPSSKFTTINGGVDVIVRNGSPGGKWYKKSEFGEIPVYASENNNGYTRFGENERKISEYSHHVQIEGEEYKYANGVNSGVYDTDKDCGNMCTCWCFLLIIAIVALLYVLINMY